MRTPRIARVVLFLTLLCATPLAAQPPLPVIMPGQTVVFDPTLPTSIDTASIDTFLLGVFTADTTSVPLKSLVSAGEPLSRAQGELGQNQDFVLPAGAIPDQLLRAQVSASLTVRGFLAMAGSGQVGVAICLDVIDMTDGIVLKSERAYADDISGSLSGSLSAGISVDVGAPHGGSAGLELAAGLGTDLTTHVLRTSSDLGLDVLMRRGHTFRLRARAVSEVKIGVAGGLGLANLGIGLLSPPNLFEAGNWQARLTGIPMASMNMPNVGLSSIGGDVLFPVIGTLFGGGLQPQTFSGQQGSTNNWLTGLGAPGGPTGFASLVSGFLGLGASFTQDETITLPGLNVTRLSIVVQADDAEKQLEIAIEDDLAGVHGDRFIASYMLPAAQGGQLELARQIVSDAIAMMLAAGETVNSAYYELAIGDAERNAGHFKRAYDRYSRAYQAVVKR